MYYVYMWYNVTKITHNLHCYTVEDRGMTDKCVVNVRGMVWYGMSLVWYGMVSYGIVSYGMVWYELGMVWYGMVWYGMV